MNIGIVIGLIKALAPGVDPEIIEQAVTDWLDDHPEATTTVQDGSITEAKLAQDVLADLAEVEELKEAIADKQDAVVTENKTGNTVTITGTANHRYLCGTVTEITITPPQTGMIDVLFTAGNACVLSLPNTVKLPDSFDPTTLTQGVVYEINIMDGVYGVVGSWT